MSDNPSSAKPSGAKQEALEAYHAFPQKFQSVMLATVSEQGIPHASYAPFVMDDNKNLYILASELAVLNGAAKNEKCEYPTHCHQV